MWNSKSVLEMQARKLGVTECQSWGRCVCVCERERGHVSTFRIYNIVVSVSLIEKVMFM